MINLWKDKLPFGLKCEEYIKNKFLINNMSMRRIDYNIEPELQRNGIDLILDDGLKIGVRAGNYIRYKKYGKNDILLETWSVFEKNISGWTYTTEADIYITTWWNQEENHLIDGYILYMKKVKPFFIKSEGKQIQNKNEGYTSYSFPIQINKFPTESIQHIYDELNIAINSKNKINISLKYKG